MVPNIEFLQAVVVVIIDVKHANLNKS